MRTKPDEIEVAIRLPIDEHKVGPYVTVAVIRPFAGQRMIEKAPWECLVGDQEVDGLHQ